jgi:hypothetical protein
MPRQIIDNLKPGEVVELAFNPGKRNEYCEYHVFLGILDEGEERRAAFAGIGHRGMYEWEAYRYEGRWAFGTSADRLSLYSTVVKLGSI